MTRRVGNMWWHGVMAICKLPGDAEIPSGEIAPPRHWKGGKDGKTKVKGQGQQMIAAFPDLTFMASCFMCIFQLRSGALKWRRPQKFLWKRHQLAERWLEFRGVENWAHKGTDFTLEAAERFHNRESFKSFPQKKEVEVQCWESI